MRFQVKNVNLRFIEFQFFGQEIVFNSLIPKKIEDDGPILSRYFSRWKLEMNIFQAMAHYKQLVHLLQVKICSQLIGFLNAFFILVIYTLSHGTIFTDLQQVRLFAGSINV